MSTPPFNHRLEVLRVITESDFDDLIAFYYNVNYFCAQNAEWDMGHASRYYNVSALNAAEYRSTQHIWDDIRQTGQAPAIDPFLFMCDLCARQLIEPGHYLIVEK